ncbi:MAG TPA: DUF192 domain-containing protein [Candidatus Binataceae bacterium]|nr:DUF192 domain-containing protein [Candidatus Binataceae bacterium]
MLQAFNQTRGTILCANLADAGGRSGQAKGLLGRDTIADDEGLLFIRQTLEPFMWMHMFFMRFAIDIVFLDRNDRVVHVCHSLKPWRVSPILFSARKALELAPGAAKRSGTMVGDRIELRSESPLSTAVNA